MRPDDLAGLRAGSVCGARRRVYRQRVMLGSTLRRLPLLVTLVTLVCACTRQPDDVGAVVVEVAGASRSLAREELAAMSVARVSERGHAYTGVLLREVLTPAELAVNAPLEARAADGYTQILAPELLGRDDALLAYAVDDGPLAAGEGPLRLVIPGSPGLSVKQLVRLARP
jgi:hypothetical protein